MYGGVAANVMLGQSCHERRTDAETHLVKTRLALVACPAAHSGLKGNTITDLESRRFGDFGAQLGDDTGTFVAETHGVLEHKGTNLGVLEVMYVRAADSRLDYLDENLIILEFGNRALQSANSSDSKSYLLELSVVDAMKHKAGVILLEVAHCVYV